MTDKKQQKYTLSNNIKQTKYQISKTTAKQPLKN